MPTVPPFAALTAPAHWRTVDFISDLHLKPEEPATFRAWEHYMRHTPADAVFILGDLFEAWIGDDSAAVPGGFEAHCGQVLRALGSAINVYFMCGNRDFLVGADFLGHHAVHPLGDPTVLVINGQRILLTHGDLLCIDDIAYQQFRLQVRAPAWQQAFLARPLAERQAIARGMRAQSEQHQAQAETYADVDTYLARQWVLAANATALIHGHTHRPADHPLGAAGPTSADLAGIAPPHAAPKRIVLSDWHIADGQHRAQVLRLTLNEGLERIDLAPM